MNGLSHLSFGHLPSPKEREDVATAFRWGQIIFLIGIFVLLLFQNSNAQTKTVADYLQVTGYVKDMGTISFTDDASSIYASTLIHNRIDLKIKPVSSFTIAAGLRTRVLISEYQNLYPGFASNILPIMA